MKKICLFSLVWITLGAAAQKIDSAWVATHYKKKEVYIKMRDGVRLFTSVYYPVQNEEKHPILLTRTPYSCSPYGENNFRNFTRNNHFNEYLKEGYIIITQDVRGRWMSEGTFVDVRPFNPKKSGQETDEASDTWDTIDWLVKNWENNNGNVGVFGISYPGFYSTMAAFSGHPALKAVSPQAPVTDWFAGDDFHHNGAFMMMDAFSFYSGFGKPRKAPTTEPVTGFKFPTKDHYQFYLQAGGLSRLAEYMGDSILFWKDLYAHTQYDSFWKARNARNYVQYIPATTPTLIVGGLFDAEDCFGAWNLYQAIEKNATNNNKLVMGPWYHGQWASGMGKNLGNVQFGSNTSEWYAREIEYPFFQYYLKGKGQGSNLPEATIFFSGENKWRQFNSWPAKEATITSGYLQKNGKLSFQKITTNPLTYSEYISDPDKPVPYTEDVHTGRTREYMTDDQRFASRRPDVLVFETETLTSDVTVAGSIVANLCVSLTSRDADFIVKLIDVFPDDYENNPPSSYIMNGYQMLVRGEVMRGKFRNSLEKAEPFIPNQITRFQYALPDVAHTFKKGHKLMVQIQSSWFPLVDRNPQQFMNIYQATAKDFTKAAIKVYHNESYISLPILK